MVLLNVSNRKLNARDARESFVWESTLKLSFYKSDQHIKLKYRKYAVLIILENRRLYKTYRQIKIDFM